MSARLVSAFVAATGIAMALPGAGLLLNGGSGYYLSAGLALVGSGLLAFRLRKSALWIYSGVLSGTIAWGLWEVGFDFWALVPRLVYLSALGSWLLLAFPGSQ